jgi:uncharacterized protein (TIGR03437 family)
VLPLKSWRVIALLFCAAGVRAQIVQQARLVPNDATGIPRVGSSVAVSADGNTMAVGGPNDGGSTSSGAAAGGVWIFTRSGGKWQQQGNKLLGSGVDGCCAGQGWSVALSADGNTLAVGGPFDGTSGAVWIFTRSGGVWTQQGDKLVGTGAIGNADQGYSLAIAADGNTVLVGGPNDDQPPGTYMGLSAYFGVGAAWVFTRSNGVWKQQGAKLVGTGAVVLPNAVTKAPVNAVQGFSVALSGDGNTALIGGPGDNLFTGTVWIFTRSAGVWAQQGQKLIGTGSGAAPHQGQSVAVSADGNTALVGAYFDGQGPGAAWVFTRSGGVWSQEGNKLRGTGATGNAQQGTSVSLSADGNTAILGGPDDNPGGAYATGAAWVFSRTGGGWMQRGSKLVGADASVATPWLGRSAAISGDATTAILGGPQDFPTGAAWVFVIPPLPLQVQSVSLAAAQVLNGGNVTGTVALTTAAPSGGISVNLSSNSTLVGLPSSVTVSAGSSSATFPISTSAVSQSQPVTITASYGGNTAQAVLTILSGPFIRPAGVSSAGGFGQLPSIAPGTWIEIYGSGFASTSRSWTGADFAGVDAPTSLDGASVTIGGLPAFLDYISPTQINAQVPSGLAAGTQKVVVTAGAVPSAPLSVNVLPVEPGLLAPPVFVVAGSQYAVALFSDGVTYALPPGAIQGLPARRAQAGDVLTLYGIGFGPVSPDIPAGQVVQSVNTLAGTVAVKFGAADAQIVYAGLAPNSVGLYQFNIVVPAVAAGDLVPVTFTLNGVAGQQTLFLPVQ